MNYYACTRRKDITTIGDRRACLCAIPSLQPHLSCLTQRMCRADYSKDSLPSSLFLKQFAGASPLPITPWDSPPNGQ